MSLVELYLTVIMTVPVIVYLIVRAIKKIKQVKRLRDQERLKNLTSTKISELVSAEYDNYSGRFAYLRNYHNDLRADIGDEGFLTYLKWHNEHAKSEQN